MHGYQYTLGQLLLGVLFLSVAFGLVRMAGEFWEFPAVAAATTAVVACRVRSGILVPVSAWACIGGLGGILWPLLGFELSPIRWDRVSQNVAWCATVFASLGAAYGAAGRGHRILASLVVLLYGGAVVVVLFTAIE
jgi:hypothetical protein